MDARERFGGDEREGFGNVFRWRGENLAICGLVAAQPVRGGPHELPESGTLSGAGALARVVDHGSLIVA
jgi:hypothetical protein